MNIFNTKPGSRNRLNKYFLTGLVVMLPIILTGYLLWLLFSWGGQIFGELLVYIPYLQDIPHLARLLLGFVMLLVFILGVGFLASHLIGRRLIKVWDNFISHVPLARLVYGTTKQFTDNFFTNRFAFRQVVAVEYPRPGSYALGFLTSDRSWKMSSGKTVYSVYLPNTPNPTGGRILLIPPDRLFKVEMTVEQALKLIVSGGMINPEQLLITNPLDEKNGRSQRTAAKNTKNKSL